MATKDETILEVAGRLETEAAKLRALVTVEGPPDPPPPPPPPSGTGVWTSAAELAIRPTSGKAWDALLAAAHASLGAPNVSNQDDPVDVRVIARALVAARTGDAAMRASVADTCLQAIGTETGGRTLALARNLVGYVVSADLVGFRNSSFVDWVSRSRRVALSGGPRDLIETHEKRPNNWGTHAGAARAAAAVYLGDTADLGRCGLVFKGWLGDRPAYAGFEYNELSWQADASRPVGVNPKGATKSGHSIDGVLPDDQRRGGAFTWPPPKVNYVWEALQGAFVQAEILTRAGLLAFEWSDQALLRTVAWLHQQAGYPAAGDDTWIPWIANYRYATNFPAPSPAGMGKNMGFTDWTHARA